MKLLTCFLSIFIGGASIAQENDFSKAKEIINDYVNNKKFPAISGAVVKGGKI
jgi:hypothetical protein